MQWNPFLAIQFLWTRKQLRLTSAMQTRNRNLPRRPPNACSLQDDNRDGTKTDLQFRQFAEVCANTEHVLRHSSARVGELAFCPTWTESRVTRTHARYLRYANWLRNGNLDPSFADSSTWPFSFFLSLRLSTAKVRQLQDTLCLCGYNG